jgi:hypothetical protein
VGSPPAHDRIDESRIGEESIGRQIGQDLAAGQGDDSA